jgi:hypothetical protein
MSGAPDTLASVYLAWARGDYMPEMIPRRTSRLPTLPGQSQLPLASLCYSILSFFPRQSRLVLGFAVAGILGAPPWCFSAC